MPKYDIMGLTNYINQTEVIEMEKHRRRYNTPYLVLALMLLLATNIGMGVVLANYSHGIIHDLLDEKVMDIAQSAADLVDGEQVRSITEADVGTPEYEEGLETVRIIMENVSADYVYIIRKEADGRFIFILDPDPEHPAEYGQEIEITPALLKAQQGITAVDDEPHSDTWGTFYTGYSPVWGTDGTVVAIAACDIDARVHKNVIKNHIAVIVLSTVIVMIFGILLAWYISRTTRRRMNQMDREMQQLMEDFTQLDALMRKSSRQRLDQMAGSQQKELLETLADGGGYEERAYRSDDLGEVSDHLRDMRDSLHHYLSYIDAQTFVDPLTGAGNKPAYQQVIRRMTEQIEAGSANFAIAFFDLNELKAINTQFGFERGDTLLFEAASLLRKVFQPKNVYRVASDEFIAVVENLTEEDMARCLTRLESEMRIYNAQHRGDPQLSIAKGIAFFGEEDTSYRTVFRRAEAMATQDKEAFYENKRDAEADESPAPEAPNRANS